MRLIMFFVLVSGMSVISTSVAQQLTTEQKFKNIQVLKGLPATELDPTMAFISGSLGVRCSYCHSNQFEKDDKPTKPAARRMLQMVFDLNKANFNSRRDVSCYTCYRGKPIPVSVHAVVQSSPGSSEARGGLLQRTENRRALFEVGCAGKSSYRRCRGLRNSGDAGEWPSGKAVLRCANRTAGATLY